MSVQRVAVVFPKGLICRSIHRKGGLRLPLVYDNTMGFEIIRNRILEITNTYEDSFRKEVLVAKKLETPPSSEVDAIAHLLWVCGEIRQTLEEEKLGCIGECTRLLSFIQGALWAMGKKQPTDEP
jgi:hypothetical protein